MKLNTCVTFTTLAVSRGFQPMYTTEPSFTLFAKPESSSVSRRGFFWSTAALTTTTLAYPQPVLAVDYKAVAADIEALVREVPDRGPTLVRLAWHSSGTYDKMSKDGGSGGGTIRFKEELAHGGNAGLGETAVKWLEPIHAKYEGISYADLYTLAGGTWTNPNTMYSQPLLAQLPRSRLWMDRRLRGALVVSTQWTLRP